MQLADPASLSVALGLLGGPIGAALARRGRRLAGGLAGGAAGCAAALVAARLFSMGGAEPPDLALAALAGAGAAVALPGFGPGPFRRRSFGSAFPRAAFAGGRGEAALAARAAADLPSRLVDAADRLGLERVLYEVEAKSGAQLAVALVRRCGRDEAAGWRLAAWLAALATATGLALAPDAPRLVAAAAAAAALAGHALARGRLRRCLVSEAVLAERAREAALDGFARAGLLRAPGRVGILVFAALAERRVVVLGDEGVDRRLAAPGGWNEVARIAADGLGSGRAVRGLRDALLRAGTLVSGGAAPVGAPRLPGEGPEPVRVEDGSPG